MQGKKMPKGIRQRKNGFYQWRFAVDRIVYSGHAKTKREAEKALIEKRYEVEHGLFVKESSITLDDWLETWLTTYKEGDSRLETIKTYRSVYRNNIAPLIGSKRLKTIRAEHLQAVLRKTADEKSRSSLELTKALLSALFKQAARNGLISSNPYLKTTPPKGKERKKKGAVSKEIQEAFLQYAAESIYSRIFQIASQTGARIGEILALRWEDIDTAAGVIKIEHTLHLSKQSATLGPPKSKEGKRIIPLTPAAVAILKEERTAQLTARLQAGQEWRPQNGLESLVFLSETGEPLDEKKIAWNVAKIRKKMQADGYSIPDNFSTHSLRHCFATRCIENGMNMKSLQKILGHASLSMTMDRYADALPETLKEEMRKVAAGL